MLIDNIRKTLKCSLSLITLDTPLLSFAYTLWGFNKLERLFLSDWAAGLLFSLWEKIVHNFPLLDNAGQKPGKSWAEAGQEINIQCCGQPSIYLLVSNWNWKKVEIVSLIYTGGRFGLSPSAFGSSAAGPSRLDLINTQEFRSSPPRVMMTQLRLAHSL